MVTAALPRSTETWPINIIHLHRPQRATAAHTQMADVIRGHRLRMTVRFFPFHCSECSETPARTAIRQRNSLLLPGPAPPPHPHPRVPAMTFQARPPPGHCPEHPARRPGRESLAQLKAPYRFSTLPIISNSLTQLIQCFDSLPPSDQRITLHC